MIFNLLLIHFSISIFKEVSYIFFYHIFLYTNYNNLFKKNNHLSMIDATMESNNFIHQNLY